MAAGHSGQRKTILFASQTFIWKGITGDINRFINNYYTYRRGKAPREKKYRLLEPLPIPEQRWKDITLDFVTRFPESKKGNNAILTVTCRLLKDRYFITYKAGELGTSTEATAQILYRYV